MLLAAAVLAAIIFGLIAANAAYGATKREVVVIGDSLLDAGTYSPSAEAMFGGGRFTTNPGPEFHASCRPLVRPPAYRFGLRELR